MGSNFWLWLAKRLPRRLVYFSSVTLLAYSTSGEYDDTEVPAIPMMDALKRYGDDFGI